MAVHFKDVLQLPASSASMRCQLAPALPIGHERQTLLIIQEIYGGSSDSCFASTFSKGSSVYAERHLRLEDAELCLL